MTFLTYLNGANWYHSICRLNLVSVSSTVLLFLQWLDLLMTLYLKYLGQSLIISIDLHSNRMWNKNSHSDINFLLPSDWFSRLSPITANLYQLKNRLWISPHTLSLYPCLTNLIIVYNHTYYYRASSLRFFLTASSDLDACSSSISTLGLFESQN